MIYCKFFQVIKINYLFTFFIFQHFHIVGMEFLRHPVSSSLNLLLSCSPYIPLAFVGAIYFSSYRSKGYITVKEFGVSCSCWIFTQKHEADEILLPVKYSTLNSVITV